MIARPPRGRGAKRGSPPLEPGEQLLLEAQGGCKLGSRSGWTLGHLLLTDRRVTCHTATRRVLDLPLANVLSVKVEKQPFVLCSKPVLVLTYRTAPPGGVALRVSLVTEHLERWRAALSHMTRRSIDEESVQRVAARLAPEAEAILWYIWQNGHANIQELAELVDADCHSDVLMKIKAEINPAAAYLLGCPVLAFMPHWVEPNSGAPIAFSWWITGRRDVEELEAGSAELARADVFDEHTHVDVVVELPGVRAENVLVTARDGRKLAISAASTAGKFRREVALPTGVHAGDATWKLTNGILLVRLERTATGSESRPSGSRTRSHVTPIQP